MALSKIGNRILAYGDNGTEATVELRSSDTLDPERFHITPPNGFAVQPGVEESSPDRQLLSPQPNLRLTFSQNEHSSHQDRLQTIPALATDVPSAESHTPKSLSSNGVQSWKRVLQALQDSTAIYRAKLAGVLRIHSSNLLADSTMKDFLRLIETSRVRNMPHRGSEFDKILLRMESFAHSVDVFITVMVIRRICSMEFARVIWHYLIALVQLDTARTFALSKASLILRQLGHSLDSLARQKHHILDDSTAICMTDISSSLGHSSIELMHICCGITIAALTLPKVNSNSILLGDLDTRFNGHQKAIDQYFISLFNSIWRKSLGIEHLSLGRHGITIEILYDWLRIKNCSTNKDSYGAGRPQANITYPKLSFSWIISQFEHFHRSSDHILVVSGGTGSGKSMLMQYLIEYLRTSRYKKSDTLSHAIDITHPPRSPGLDMVKNLLLQVMNLNIGDHRMFDDLCLAYERIKLQHQVDGESILWGVLTETLQRQTRDTLLIFDGLDQIKGGEEMIARTIERIGDICHTQSNIRAVLFSRPFSSEIIPGIRWMPLEPKIIRSEIDLHIQQFVQKFGSFQNLQNQEKSTLIQQIVNLNLSSFVEVGLLLQLLSGGRAYNTILTILEDIPKSSSGLVNLLCAQIDFKDPVTLSLLSLLLVAERPLTAREAVALSTDSRAPEFLEKDRAIESIKEDCKRIVNIQDGFIQLFHPLIKQHLLSPRLSFSLSLRDIQQDTTIQALRIIKRSLKGLEAEPAYDIGATQAPVLFHSKVEEHSDLDYAVRYYVLHYRASSLHVSAASSVSCAKFSANYIDSILLAQLELYLWDSQSNVDQVEEMHLLALDMRRQCFGSKAKSLVQTYVNLSKVQRRLQHFPQALTSVFQAWSLGCALLGRTSGFCLRSANLYLEILGECPSPKMTTDNRATIETIYDYLWQTNKIINGNTQEKTVRAAVLFANYYVSLHDLKSASRIYQEVYEACINQLGPLNKLTVAISQSLIKVLEGLGKFDDCLDICSTFFHGTVESLDPWDQTRVEATMRLARIYELKSCFVEAEALLLMQYEILQRSTAIHHEKSRVHTAYLEMTLELAQLRVKCNNSKDAIDILSSIQRGYRTMLHTNNTLEAVLLTRFRLIGEELTKLERFEEADAIFSSLWFYYREARQITTVEAILVALQLADCQKNTQQLSSEEKLLQDLLNSLMAKAIVSSYTVKVCQRLALFYGRVFRISEAVDVYLTVLGKYWPAVLDKEPSLSLPNKHRKELIEIAFELAVHYTKLERFNLAEKIYTHTYGSCKASLSLGDQRVIDAVHRLASFFEETGNVEKAVQSWNDYLNECHGILGHRHEISIQISYCLAHLYQRHDFAKYEDVLIDIAKTCDIDNDTIVTSAIEAIIALCDLYEQTQRVTELLKWYQRLWDIYRDHAYARKINFEHFLRTFSHYLVLIVQDQGIKEAVRIARQCSDVTCSIYGHDDPYTIQARLELARILEAEEAMHHEAIKIYVELTKTSIKRQKDHDKLRALILTTKERLAHLYTRNSLTSNKAEVLWFEIWEDIIVKHGYAHDESLAYLAKFVTFFKHIKEKESTATALTFLQQVVVGIISQELDELQHFRLGQAIGKQYLELNSRPEGERLLQDLRLQIMNRHLKILNKSKCTLNQIDLLDRRCLVFIQTWEETLKGNLSISLSFDILKLVFRETCFFESWKAVMMQGSRLESQLCVGARLRGFLLDMQRYNESEAIEEELWSVFSKALGTEAVKSGAIWNLFLTCAKEMRHARADMPLFDAVGDAIQVCYDKGHLRSCVGLAEWLVEMIKQRGGFEHKEFTKLGLRFALWLTSRSINGGSGPDQAAEEKLRRLVSEVLNRVFHMGALNSIDTKLMPLDQLNVLVQLLGKHKFYAHAELILQTLWRARTNAEWGTNLSLVVRIGKRLCEVQFAAGHKDTAVALAEDICYNLYDVWGYLDRHSIEATGLLASFYNAMGCSSKAIALHYAIIHEATITATTGDRVEHSVAVQTALEQSRMLKHAYQRQEGQWNNNNNDVENEKEKIAALLQSCVMMFGEIEDLWEGLGTVDDWIQESIPEKITCGFWQPPMDWAFLLDSKEGSHHVI